MGSIASPQGTDEAACDGIAAQADPTRRASGCWRVRQANTLTFKRHPRVTRPVWGADAGTMALICKGARGGRGAMALEPPMAAPAAFPTAILPRDGACTRSMASASAAPMHIR